MTDPKTSSHWDKLRIHFHMIFACLILLHVIFYLVYWFANAVIIPSVDGFVKGLIKLNLPYVYIVVGLSFALGIWSIIRIIQMQYHLKRSAWTKSHANWIYFVLALLFLAVFYGSLILITKQDPSQRGVISHLLSISRVVTDALLLFVVTFILRTALKKMAKSTDAKRRLWHNAAYVTICVIFLAAWVVPVIFAPTWAYHGELAAKPALLAHRGASMLAPENTLAAAQLADKLGAYGFESDVRVSQDGVPFLMHDETLERTTNVAEVFPGRQDERAETFTLEEIQELNPNWWFILNDPYGSIKNGLVSQSSLTEYQTQGVPTLADTLHLIKQTDMILLYDLRNPPAGHPYASGLFEHVYETLKAERMEDQIWLILDKAQIDMVSKETPGVKRVIGVSSTDLPSAAEVVADNYQVVNVDKGISNEAIKAYKDTGLAVNIYVVDQPWLFSQYWVLSVDSITTNAIQTLSKMSVPVLAMPFTQYLLFWALLGMVLCLWMVSAGKWIKKEKVVPVPEEVAVTEEISAPEEAAVSEEISTLEEAPVPEEISTVEPEINEEVETPILEPPGQDISTEESMSPLADPDMSLGEEPDAGRPSRQNAEHTTGTGEKLAMDKNSEGLELPETKSE
jgi:glycerophosphoryl diester phosphodiesterase